MERQEVTSVFCNAEIGEVCRASVKVKYCVADRSRETSHVDIWHIEGNLTGPGVTLKYEINKIIQGGLQLEQR